MLERVQFVGGGFNMMIFIGLLFLLIGFGLLVYGVLAVFKVRRQQSRSVKAKGTVEAFGTEAGKSGFIYCPQVSFQVPGARIFRFQSSVGTQPPSYRIGQTVSVMYEAADPNKAEIDSAMALWFAPGCFVLMALLFVFGGLSMFGIGLLVELGAK